MNAPIDNPIRPWDRWQDVRTPETVAEALAGITMVTHKVDALTCVADRYARLGDAPRADAMRATTERWREQGRGLTWALEMLRAGESPMRAKYRALQARLHELAIATTRCPDAASLVAHLLARAERLTEHRDRLAMEVQGLEHLLSLRNAEIADLSRQLRAAHEVRRG